MHYNRVVRRFRSTTLIISLSLFWLSLAVFGGVGYWRALHLVPPELNKSEILKVLSQFRTTQKSEGLDIASTWRNSIPEELLNPKNFVPSADNVDAAEFLKLLAYGDSCASLKVPVSKNANLQKLRQWIDFKCKRSSVLAESVWKNSPMTHPLGGSWAHWLFLQGYGSEEWLLNERAYLHALEWRFLKEKMPPPQVALINTFSPGELAQFLEGIGLLIAEHKVTYLVYNSPEKDRIQIFERADWDRFMLEAPVQVAPSSSADCAFRELGQCWQINPKLQNVDPTRYLYWLLAAILGLTGTLFSVLWIRARDEAAVQEHQQLVMQTLTHELRHPVTGLRLSVESMRSSYDQLPEEIKIEFLRLATVAERMNRLVDSSQQYLKLLAKEQHFSFRKDNITSLNDFMESVLEPYEGKINFKKSPNDVSCVFDGYWMSTCIVNLVKNALIHGRQPIDVSWERHGTSIAFIVQDSGKGPTRSLKELTAPQIKTSSSQGMGLGLSLVNRLTVLMHGVLSMTTNPSRFVLTFKGVCNDQNLIG